MLDWIKDILLPVTQITVLLFGVVWTWILFVKNRVSFPFPQVALSATDRPLSKQFTLLTVSIAVQNASKVALQLSSGHVYVRKLEPVEKHFLEHIDQADEDKLRTGNVSELWVKEGTQIAWSEIGYREICCADAKTLLEPGESEHFTIDFVIPRDVKTTRTVVYFKNDKRTKQSRGVANKLNIKWLAKPTEEVGWQKHLDHVMTDAKKHKKILGIELGIHARK